MTRPARAFSQAHVLADTSALFALGYRQDANFQTAQRIAAALSGGHKSLVTTTYVIAETHALFLARGGYYAGTQFLRRMESSVVTVVRPAEDDEVAAKRIIYRYTDKDFSLTDAISFAVMERLGISTAFTFDSDFLQYGFANAQP